MLLPGRVPGYKNSDVKLLPSSTTKRGIWELYIQSASSGLLKSVAYSTFTQLWRQLLPHILVMKPMSDLCWICQQNSTAIARSANKPEEEKSAVSSLIIIIMNHTINYTDVCVCRLSEQQSNTCWKLLLRGRYIKILWKRQRHALLLNLQ